MLVKGTELRFREGKNPGNGLQNREMVRGNLILLKGQSRVSTEESDPETDCKTGKSPVVDLQHQGEVPH